MSIECDNGCNGSCTNGNGRPYEKVATGSAPQQVARENKNNAAVRQSCQRGAFEITGLCFGMSKGAPRETTCGPYAKSQE